MKKDNKDRGRFNKFADPGAVEDISWLKESNEKDEDESNIPGTHNLLSQRATDKNSQKEG